MKTEEKLIKLVSKHLKMPVEKVTADKAFVDDLGCDSLDTIELVMVAEEAFSIELEDELFMNDNYRAFNISQAAKMISEKLEIK